MSSSAFLDPLFAGEHGPPAAGARLARDTRMATVVRGVVLGLAILLALLLALPGQTVTTKYLNDLFIFLDGAHRIMAGQVPNRDFHSALGPLSFYIPAAGYWLSGSFGGAMPVGMALVVLALAAAAVHIIGSRLAPPVAIPLAAYLLLIAAVPINVGEGIGDLSFGMFYNRIGWAALGLLLVLHLEPARPGARQNGLDALCAASLVLLMLYTKVSFGVVGLAFGGLILLRRRNWGWALTALALVALTGLLVEAVWRSSAAHLADLRLASQVSGSFGGLEKAVRTVLANLADFVLFAFLAGLALWAARSLRDLLFFGFCAAAGVMLLSQNYQNHGVVTVVVGAAVAVEMLIRSQARWGAGPRWIARGAPLVLLAMLLPPIVHNGLALTLHAGLAWTERGEPIPLPKFSRIRHVKLWNEGEHPIFARYRASIADGAAALARLEPPPSRVLVLDFVNPFTAGLGLEPPKGDSPWHHWGRTLDENNAVPAGELFRDVRVVMEPKWPIESWTANGMREVYASFLAEHYELARETGDWKVFVARAQTPGSGARSAEALVQP